MKRTKNIFILLLLCFALFLSACAVDPISVSSTENSNDNLNSISNDSDIMHEAGELLTVHYLDVGQGDSVFIEFPDETCMLIDASVSEYKEEIAETISELGYDEIDYVIATHPHADHIGGMAYILDSFTIGCIYLPDVSASTKTYTDMAETILEHDIKAVVAEAGVVMIETEGLRAEILAPHVIDESDQNKNSAVLYLKYGDTSFLFMGDADTDIEKQIGNIDCDVLKVGHHGSRTASDETFLRQASPLYAIISCGEGNSYGHPHQEAVERLTACGANILRTDLLGNITVCSDGKNIFVRHSDETVSDHTHAESNDPSQETDRSETSIESYLWIINTSSKKIHDPDCKHAKDIADKNKAETNKSIKELTEEGYSACGTCKPHD